MDHAEEPSRGDDNDFHPDVMFARRLRTLVQKRKQLAATAFAARLRELVAIAHAVPRNAVLEVENNLDNSESSQNEVVCTSSAVNTTPLTTRTTASTTTTTYGASEQSAVLGSTAEIRSVSGIDDTERRTDGQENDKSPAAGTSVATSHTADHVTARFKLLDATLKLKSDIQSTLGTYSVPKLSAFPADRSNDLHVDSGSDLKTSGMSTTRSKTYSPQQQQQHQYFIGEQSRPIMSSSRSAGAYVAEQDQRYHRFTSNEALCVSSHAGYSSKNVDSSVAHLYFDYEYEATFETPSISRFECPRFVRTPTDQITSYYYAIRDHGMLTSSLRVPEAPTSFDVSTNHSLSQNGMLSPDLQSLRSASASYSLHEFSTTVVDRSEPPLSSSHSSSLTSVSLAEATPSRSGLCKYFQRDESNKDKRFSDNGATNPPNSSCILNPAMQTRTYYRGRLDAVKERYAPNAPWHLACLSKTSSFPERDHIGISLRKEGHALADHVISHDLAECFDPGIGYNSFRVYSDDRTRTSLRSTRNVYFQHQTNYPFRALPSSAGHDSSQSSLRRGINSTHNTTEETKPTIPVECRVPVQHLADSLKYLVRHGPPRRPPFFDSRSGDRAPISFEEDNSTEVFRIGPDGKLNPFFAVSR